MGSPDLQLHPGILLIAPPLSEDPNFRRTVVLLCEHGAEGSFGLILNRALSLQLGEVLEELGAYAGTLSLGGPVQPNTLHFLHRHADRIPDAISVTDGVYWGGSFETIRTLIESGQATARDLRFFLGYAGWSAGQLEAEVDVGGWILNPAQADLVFADHADGLWRTVLRRMGGEYALLANFPDDPRMN